MSAPNSIRQSYKLARGLAVGMIITPWLWLALKIDLIWLDQNLSHGSAVQDFAGASLPYLIPHWPYILAMILTLNFGGAILFLYPSALIARFFAGLSMLFSVQPMTMLLFEHVTAGWYYAILGASLFAYLLISIFAGLFLLCLFLVVRKMVR